MAVTRGFVLALDLAQVLALVLVVVRIRVAVFVFLYFGVLGRVLLSLGSVFGCVLIGLRSVFSRILVLSLCCTRCYHSREGNTEQATSNESVQHFWSPVRNFVAHFYSTDKTRMPERSRGHWPLKVTCPCGQGLLIETVPVGWIGGVLLLRYTGGLEERW